MAIVTNEWSLVTFQPPGNAAWTGYTPPYPNIQSKFGAAIFTSSPILAFCIDDSGPIQMTTFDGGLFSFDAAVVNASTAQTTEVTTLDSGEVWYSVRAGDGSWLWYSSVAGVVNRVSSPGALSAFLA